MSFSTNFQPIFHYTGDHHYDNIYASYLEPAQDCARAELARLERSLIVPEFADSTPSTSLTGTEFLLRRPLTGVGSPLGLLLFRGSLP